MPFFSATLRQRSALRQQRVWEEADVDLLSGVVAEPDDGGHGFDVAQVQDVWRGALAGRAAARDELLLQRVVWRAAFTDHLAAVNGEAIQQPRTRSTVVGPTPERTSTRILHRLAVRADDIPLARRLARTRVGRELRRRLGVQTADGVAVVVLRPPVPQSSAEEVLALAMLNRTGPEVGSWEWAQDFRAAMSPVQYAQLREAYLRRFGPPRAGAG